MGSGQLSLKIQKKFPTIEDISFKILIEAYNSIFQLNQYSLDWEEEQINQELVRFMKKSELRVTHSLTIGIERKLFDENKPPINDNNPKKLPKIDINIVSWSFQEGVELEYFFEAKNLYENDYKKRVASIHINRYIDTGIENFRISRYYNGSLIGYILDGDTTKVIDKLNIQLTKNRKNKNRATNHLSSFERKNCIENFDYYYESKHLTPLKEKMLIKHIFLKF
jgi:hypothetical protein